MPSVIEATRLASFFGNGFLRVIKVVKVLAIYGKLTNLSSHPIRTNQCIGKGERQTNHMERWHNRLRQSNARFVRKMLSFSKSDSMHEIVTRPFIINHNLSITG
jgi:IS1 family transposase